MLPDVQALKRLRIRGKTLLKPLPPPRKSSTEENQVRSSAFVGTFDREGNPLLQCADTFMIIVALCDWKEIVRLTTVSKRMKFALTAGAGSFCPWQRVFQQALLQSSNLPKHIDDSIYATFVHTAQGWYKFCANLTRKQCGGCGSSGTRFVFALTGDRICTECFRSPQFRMCSVLWAQKNFHIPQLEVEQLPSITLAGRDAEEAEGDVRVVLETQAYQLSCKLHGGEDALQALMDKSALTDKSNRERAKAAGRNGVASRTLLQSPPRQLAPSYPDPSSLVSPESGSSSSNGGAPPSHISSTTSSLSIGPFSSPGSGFSPHSLQSPTHSMSPSSAAAQRNPISEKQAVGSAIHPSFGVYTVTPQHGFFSETPNVIVHSEDQLKTAIRCAYDGITIGVAGDIALSSMPETYHAIKFVGLPIPMPGATRQPTRTKRVYGGDGNSHALPSKLPRLPKAPSTANRMQTRSSKLTRSVQTSTSPPAATALDERAKPEDLRKKPSSPYWIPQRWLNDPKKTNYRAPKITVKGRFPAFLTEAEVVFKDLDIRGYRPAHVQPYHDYRQCMCGLDIRSAVVITGCSITSFGSAVIINARDHIEEPAGSCSVTHSVLIEQNFFHDSECAGLCFAGGCAPEVISISDNVFRDNGWAYQDDGNTWGRVTDFYPRLVELNKFEGFHEMGVHLC